MPSIHLVLISRRLCLLCAVFGPEASQYGYKKGNDYYFTIFEPGGWILRGRSSSLLRVTSLGLDGARLGTLEASFRARAS